MSVKCVDDIFGTTVHFATKPQLILWCIIMSWSVMQKNWFPIFKVKVTERAHVIKIWQFLLYLLNCWSFCNQTCFYDILCQSVLWNNWTAVFRSRSQQNFRMPVMFIWTIPSEPCNTLLRDLAWWCIIISQSVMQKEQFTVLKVKVTVTFIW